jgi:hypothetical protein
MKTYKFENATIYVHGEVDKDVLRKATIKLVKDSRKYKAERRVSK